jgi:hypothetical protein
MDPPYSVPGCELEGIGPDDSGTVVVHARAAPEAAPCPACGVRSDVLHGSYMRQQAEVAFAA